MAKDTSISVTGDTEGAIRAAKSLDAILRFVRVSSEVMKLSDIEWEALRDSEDERRA